MKSDKLFQFLHNLVDEYVARWETLQCPDEDEVLVTSLHHLLDMHPWKEWEMDLIRMGVYSDLVERAAQSTSGHAKAVILVNHQESRVESKKGDADVDVEIRDYRVGADCDVCGLYTRDERLAKVDAQMKGAPYTKRGILVCQMCMGSNRINVVNKLVDPKGDLNE